MATKAERAVIAAARCMEGPDDVQGWDALSKSLDALDAERAAPPAADAPPVELDITWADLCSGDLMFSTKTGRWVEALEIRHLSAGVKVRLTGGERNKPPIQFTRPASTAVKVRRAAAMAVAVEALSIAFSGPGI